jgi:hypothetical protein
LFGTAQPRAQLVQLQVRQVEITEAVLVQGLCMFPSASQPGDDGGLPVAEDPFGRRSVQSFGQRREDHGDLMRGSFQTVQGRVAASLAAKGLDLLGTAMLAIPDQRVDVRLGDPEVPALLIGTGEALCIYAFGSSSPAFHLVPGPHRQRRWSHNR